MLYKLLVDIEVAGQFSMDTIKAGKIIRINKIDSRGNTNAHIMWEEHSKLEEGREINIQASVLLLGGERING
jgi:hypothetical protein